MVLDTHTHVWEPPSDAHPWITTEIMADVETFSVSPVYTADRLLADMDRAGIDEAVVVNYALTDWQDNIHVIRAVEEHDRLSGIVTVDVFADDAADHLRDLLAIDGILGFRLGAICPREQMWRTFDPSTTWLSDAIEETAIWAVAREADALVQILAHVDQLDQAIDLVERYPDLTYVFDHFAHAAPTTLPAEGSFSRFADLAAFDGVGVKVSEIVHRSNEEFPYTDVHGHVRWLVDTFGRERVCWGSDFPNVSDAATYEESLGWLDHVDGLTETDREWLTGRSFRQLAGTD